MPAEIDTNRPLVCTLTATAHIEAFNGKTVDAIVYGRDGAGDEPLLLVKFTDGAVMVVGSRNGVEELRVGVAEAFGDVDAAHVH